MNKRTIIGIPPSYNEDQSLDLKSTKKYIEYLEANKADCLMTTAGTSHFNLLSNDEIHLFNKCICDNFKKEKIIGIPALSSIEVKKFINKTKEYKGDAKLMFLFPDRFYSEEDVIDFFKYTSNIVGEKIYIHGKTIRNATGGSWNYNSYVLNKLYRNDYLLGIKEEHPSLMQSYNFINKLDKEIDVIVAGGSMRRYSFLKSAGANSFLSGIGNFWPKIEKDYLLGNDKMIHLENKLFNVFMKHGWHSSLRIGLREMGLGCSFNRQPWPRESKEQVQEIINILGELKSEK